MITDSNLTIDGCDIIGGKITLVSKTYKWNKITDEAFYFSNFEIKSVDETILISGKLNEIITNISDPINVQTTAFFMGSCFVHIVGRQTAIGHSLVMVLEGTAW